MTDLKIAVYPTDTIWGIGADIHDKKSVEEVSRIKKRPLNQPQTVLFTNLEHLGEYLDLSLYDINDLRDLFKLEVSVGFPLKNFRKEIPKWIYCESDIVGIRVLEGIGLDPLFDFFQNPITTTSFNLTGEEVVKNVVEAEKLIESLGVGSHTKLFDLPVSPSGNASSFCRIGESGGLEFLRKGTNYKEIEKYERLLAT